MISRFSPTQQKRCVCRYLCQKARCAGSTANDLKPRGHEARKGHREIEKSDSVSSLLPCS